MEEKIKYSAIITAGGTSSRFGNKNKLLEKINGRTVIEYTVNAFIQANIDEIIICTNGYIMDELTNIFKHNNNIKIIKGGSTRQESVFNGIKSASCNYVLIHDGARPMVTQEVIRKTMSKVVESKAVSVMTKTIDTIKEVDETGKIIRTIDRSKLYNTQTPQAFDYNLIKSTHEKLVNENFTDDAGMVESLGIDVYIVDGDYKNIKITTTSDIALAKIYLEEIYEHIQS